MHRLGCDQLDLTPATTASQIDYPGSPQKKKSAGFVAAFAQKKARQSRKRKDRLVT